MRKERDPFLEEAWEHHAEHETSGRSGDDLENGENTKARDIYARLEGSLEMAKKDPMAAKLLAGLKKSIFRYLQTVDQLSIEKIKWQNLPKSEQSKPEVKESMREADTSRHFAHNSLIDDLNIISRYCVKNNLDNGWRNMLGSDRKQVTEWALQIGPYLSKLELGEKNNHNGE